MEFCEPLFIVGNALLLSPSGILYDKVYCGAACPGEHIQLLKNMLRIGGLLVLPSENSVSLCMCVCKYVFPYVSTTCIYIFIYVRVYLCT